MYQYRELAPLSSTRLVTTWREYDDLLQKLGTLIVNTLSMDFFLQYCKLESDFNFCSDSTSIGLKRIWYLFVDGKKLHQYHTTL